MPRIISGRFKSRLLKTPRYGKTRPMGDRARMALFNILGDLGGVESVLDAYGGSGVLALEAVSRGAKAAVVIEINRRAYPDLVANVELLGLKGRVKTYRANNLTCLNNLGLSFDLIFLDPPYDDIRPGNLLKLADYLTPAGRLVLSYPPHFAPPFKPPAWETESSKAYAGLRLAVYGRGGPSAVVSRPG